jgi:UDP-N-acetylmuramate dehydrogenase
MVLYENISLKPYNSFGIDVMARYFSSLESIDQLESLNHPYTITNRNNLLVLGGGSNILFTKPFDGWVLKNELKGIRLIEEDAETYLVEAAGGENWHEFVMHCIEQGWGGLENLSLIPGSVGASPIQNIGAYGVEMKDFFHCLDAYHLQEKTVTRFHLSDCHFGYRDSIFKNKQKHQWIILNVRFLLRKKQVLATSYGAIFQELEKMGITEPTIVDISNAVIRIRTSKLPDPKQIGNAGSFFKNPIITKTQFDLLIHSFPKIQAYPSGNNHMKLAAGWMIEQCGWKGYRKADAGCHAQQALVLVNYGYASGSEILDLSTQIIESVFEKFCVRLEREVNIL